MKDNYDDFDDEEIDEPKYDRHYNPVKSKCTAVILAILFGTFGWLYTYKYDAWKFWVNLCLCIVTGGIWGIVSFIWVLIDQSTKPKDFYRYYFRD